MVVFNQRSEFTSKYSRPRPKASWKEKSLIIMDLEENQTTQISKPQTTPGTITAPTPSQPSPAPKQDLSFQSPGQQSQSSQSSGSTTMDLLGDLGGDPFASSAPAPPPSSGGGGFADFSSFNSQFTASAQTNLPFQNSSNPLVPMGNAAQTQPVPTANGTFSAPASTPAAAPPAQTGGDKYASLADLFSSEPATTTQSSTVNWSGSSGDSLNWGGSNTTAGSGINWDGSAVKGPAPNQTPNSGVNWNNQPATATSGSSGLNWNSSSNSGANPFGGTQTAVPSQPSMGAASNPFGGAGGQSLFGGQPTSTPAGFGQQAPGYGQQPTSASMGGFGQPPTTATGAFGNFGGVPSSGIGGAPQQPAGGANFGHFGMQNGGGGFSSAGNVAPATGGFGVFNQPQTMSNFGNAPAAAGTGWGQPTPTANPFMSAASQPVAPKSSSNPFL